MKIYRPPIPPEEIPEGVRLCIKNCKRLWKDAKILYNNKSYSSAILLLILAKEEFAKALLLLKHKKDKQEIDNKKVNQYFGDHETRLKEFQKFFYESLPGFDKQRAEKFSNMWFFDKETREKYTYVNWGQLGWSYPEYKLPKHWGFVDEGTFAKSQVEFIMSELKQVLWKFEQNANYKKIIQKLIVDRPNGEKLYEIIKQVTKLENPTSKTEIKKSKIVIKLEIMDINKKSEFEAKLKQKISQRFPKYKIEIIIKKIKDQQN